MGHKIIKIGVNGAETTGAFHLGKKPGNFGGRKSGIWS